MPCRVEGAGSYQTLPGVAHSGFLIQVEFPPIAETWAVQVGIVRVS